MAIIANIFIDQGTDYEVTIDVTDTSDNVIDLNGYSAGAQIRKTYGSTTIAETFGTSITASTGKVTLSLTDTQTTGLKDFGRYVYDLVITDGSGTKTRVIEGQAIITPGVTR